MSIDNSLNSQIFYVIVKLIMAITWTIVFYYLGYVNGFLKGWDKSPNKKETSNYVYADGRILRFAAGEKPILIDLKNNKVISIFPAGKIDSNDDMDVRE